jgi:riboflavin synthase
MFTGIVETTGIILQVEKQGGCKHFTIQPVLSLDDLKPGCSVLINGVCLTVTQLTDRNFKVTAVPETLSLTNLDYLAIDHHVNIERSLTMSTRLGGHLVQGHIDGTGRISEIIGDHSDALLVKISISPQLSKYIVNKGYIGLDGMSITIIESHPLWFSVKFIPHTQKCTIIPLYRVGSMINIETDILGKYIEKILGVYQHAI